MAVVRPPVLMIRCCESDNRSLESWRCLRFSAFETTAKVTFFNVAASARGDEVAVLRPVVGQVRHVHLKDVVGRNAGVLGRGKGRLDEVITMLKKAGYEGALSCETKGSQDADESQRMAGARIQLQIAELVVAGILPHDLGRARRFLATSLCLPGMELQGSSHGPP